MEGSTEAFTNTTENYPDSKNEPFESRNFISYISYGSALVLLAFYWERATIKRYCKAEMTYDRFIGAIWLSRFKTCKILTDYNLFFIVFSSVFTAIAVMYFDGNRKNISYGNTHLLLSCLFFVVHCLIVNLQQKSIWFPPNVDYISLLMTYFMSVVLVINQVVSEKEDYMFVQLHLYLTALIVMQILTLFLEIAHPNNITVPIMRCCFCLLQGTWFIQMGVQLFCPLKFLHFDAEVYNSQLIIMASFAGHCATDFLVILFFGHWFHHCMSKRHVQSHQEKRQSIESEKLISPDRNPLIQ